jgi:hypothetical protein
MANPYRVFIRSISTDGTNLYVEAEVFDGLHAFPAIRPTFMVGTTAATITNYLQTVANNQPVLDGTLGALVGTFINGQ